ncbi:preprotein translocase subunit SecE [Kytococcus aerolatus]|uniref:Protein translocase subunit SecE n=1 Tax=Kytococcus aerolatus TaxID=592308 RepID=A0A212TA30_9MICO|nr:preprotein translocase subunit SecE [Kytococcus aerolatus]SNC62898.1 preprotein translocase subunit SecE [Kytococcus aerolatus]
MTEHSAAPAEHGTPGSHGELPLRERKPEGGNPVSRAVSAIGLFLQQVMDELSKVVRPTREELVSYTIVVIVFVVAMMLFVFGLDQLFSWVVEKVFA